MTEVNKSVAPYYDDYDKTKNFHEMLFRPARGVQVREMNQLQSMFNEQIKRFADHTFEEGSVVIPGQTNYSTEYSYVTLTIADFSNISSQLVGGAVLENGSGVKAIVKQFVEATQTDNHTAYIEYTDGSNTNSSNIFEETDSITIYAEDGTTTIGTASVITKGKGSKFSISSGVYYLNGKFVLVADETILLDKYSNEPSKSVCIEYQEEIITHQEDSSLYDNASGEPNETAPGADRLRVNTRLVQFELNQLDDLPDNCFEIFRIKDGEVQRKVDKSDYSLLNDTLAQRTYEESGDYTVKSFGIGLEEHDTVFGTESQDQFVAQLDPGIAYVKGYRVETLSKTNVIMDKARTTSIINNSSISTALGYYINVQLNANSHLPDTESFQKGIFKNLTGTPVGTGRVRAIRKSGNEYQFYLFDLRLPDGTPSSSFISSSDSFVSTEGLGFDVNVTSGLQETSENSLVFPMNVEFVRSLYNELGESDTSFSTIKRFTGTLNTSGQISFSAGSNQVFLEQNPVYAIGQFTDDNTELDVTNNYALTGNPNGSGLTIDVGSGSAGRPVTVFLQMAKQQVQQKVKSLENSTATGSVDSNSRISLNKADAYEITNITDDQGNDVTNKFTLRRNVRKSFYDVSEVELKSGETAVMPVTISFKYYGHSDGDFFGPDSYVNIPFGEVPTEDGRRLSDVIDFRPRVSDSGDDFFSTGSVSGAIPTPYSVMRSDIEHYLPRIDKLYVDSRQNFRVAKGVPALQPKEPNDPPNSMVLYKIEIPAYTPDISEIDSIKVKNRRYTMRDIGNIAQRVSNVEYYVSLNSLESEADSRQIIDGETGMNRFKNGFLTDRFVDHSVGDFAWQNYHVSMAENGELRPEFSLNAVDLEMNTSSSTGVVVNGDIVTLPFTHETYVTQNQRSETMNVNPYAVFRWDGAVTLTPSVDSWIDPIYTQPDVTYRIFNNGELTQTWNSWELNWVGGETSETETETSTNRTMNTKMGQRISTTVVNTTTTTRTNIEVVNDKVIDTSVIPYMRSKEILIEGEGNRPNAKMHFFFDSVKINNYVKPVGGSYGNDVVTDGDGKFEAVFLIPNTSQRRFKTGQKQFIVTDEPNNNRQLSTSYAETMFTASGIRQVRRRTIVATRNIETSVTSRTTTETRWVDPLAQSFLVERNGGGFITKIDVFFATKDQRVPVTLQVREMENGQPTQRIVPGADVMLYPSEVNTSEDGSVPTTFEFEYPVHLLDQSEYCFVILSNSNNYNAWIGRLGERNLGNNQYIVEQPYAGVLFKSQNNSTWTADQTADLQFRIYMANFDTSSNGLVYLENTELDKIVLENNPIETVDGSSKLIIHTPRHNYIQGGTITIQNATGGNGFALNEINGDWTITDVLDPNRIEITSTGVANASGFIGEDTVTVSNTIQATLLRPNVPTIELDGTSVEYGVKGTRGQSIDGNENSYSQLTQYFPVANDRNNLLPQPWVITNRLDEQNNIGGSRSLSFRLRMNSGNSNISPVLDLQGLSVITPCVLVDYKDQDLNDGSNNFANYRTRVSGLKLPADSLNIFLDIMQGDEADTVITARYGNSEEEVLESSWEPLNQIVYNTSPNEYRECEFAVEGRSEFTHYQVMIQLKSKNASMAPICKRLRCIANLKG